MKCSRCGFENIPEARFCGMCGNLLAVACKKCGFANPVSYRFCVMCGTALEGQPPPGLEPYPPQPAEGLPTPAPGGQEMAAMNPDLVQLVGQRRVATVILADVKNSTILMEKIGTEAWVAIMNHVFQVLETVIYRFGGQVGQFRGDGLVAFFGAQAADEDDPEHAVLAALAMLQAIQPYSTELDQKQSIDLKLRVGVNTGEIIVTSIGERGQYREEDTAMGEAVALAARMEASAEPGTVLVSGNTYELVKNRFDWKALGEIKVKGVSYPLAVYRPLRPIPEIEESREPEDFLLSSILSGREKEYNLLVERVTDLCNGRGGVVLISGDKGMGKSFLVSQVRQHFLRQGMMLERPSNDDLLQADPKEGHSSCVNLAWLRASCRSFEQDWAYSMWIDLFRNWLQVLPDETEEDIVRRLHEKCEQLWGSDHDHFYPFLAIFLSLPLDESEQARVKNLPAEGVQNQIRLAVRSWVEMHATQGPVVISLSDIHWADASSLGLLDYCLPVCEQFPVLWLLMARSDRSSPAWELRHRVETEYPHRLLDLVLQPLKDGDGVAMITQLVGAGTLAPETQNLIIQKSEGNPFYIQELLHSLAAQEVLVCDPETGKWRQTRAVTSLDLPSSLQTSLQARIDRLSPGERAVLQAAAVIGSTFWRSVLETIMGGSEVVRTGLAGLLRAQLIQERNPVPNLGIEYVFESTLVRDVAYESLLSAQRDRYHLAVARYLEDFIDLEGGKQFDSLLAYHFRNAGEWRKELFYTLNAADQSRRVYANEEAIGHYDRALGLLDAIDKDDLSPDYREAVLSQRFEVLSGRREMYTRIGRLDAARDDSYRLMEIAHQLNDNPAWRIDALLSQPELNDPRTRDELMNRGLQMARQALDLARESGDPQRELLALLAIGQALVVLKEPGWQETGEEGIRIARELGDSTLEVNILLRIANAYGVDNLPRSLEYLQSALEICQKLDDKYTQMELLRSMSPQYERAGDYFKALTAYEQPRLQLAREVGDRYSEGHALMFCGQIQAIYLGDIAGGFSLCESALHLWENFSSRLYLLLRMAQMKALQRDFQASRAYLELAKPLVLLDLEDLGRAGYSLVQCILWNAIGDAEHLRMVFDIANDVRQMVSHNLVSRQYHMAAACELSSASLGLARLSKNPQERRHYRLQALEASQFAVETYRDFGFVQAVECVSEEILYRHSQALRINGRRKDADHYLREAYGEMMRKHGLIPPESPFSRTYLEEIGLHRAIRAAYETRFPIQK